MASVAAWVRSSAPLALSKYCSHDSWPYPRRYSARTQFAYWSPEPRGAGRMYADTHLKVDVNRDPSLEIKGSCWRLAPIRCSNGRFRSSDGLCPKYEADC